MIWNLDPWWLGLAIAVVTLLCYLFALGLTALIGRDGFGELTTASILSIGFFGSIFALNSYGVRVSELTEATFTGLVGSFILLMAVLALKALVKRI